MESSGIPRVPEPGPETSKNRDEQVSNFFDSRSIPNLEVPTGVNSRVDILLPHRGPETRREHQFSTNSSGI